MDSSRKNITVSVSRKSYQRAKLWAANHNITLSRLVAGFLSTVDINKSALESIGYSGDFKDFISRLDGGK